MRGASTRGARPGCCALALLIALAACRGARESEGRQPAETRRPVDIVEVSAKDDGQWVMPARDYANTRFSGLSQITAQNVKSLRMVWSFSTGTLRGHEGQPLVVGGTMYVTTPWPNVAYAFDLTRDGYPLRWKYRPDALPAANGVACCDVVNRGPAYVDGRIIYNLLDGRTVALDAETGKELWVAKVGDIDRGESMTMAPLVVKGKVLVGVSGGEFGVRGSLVALDAATGKEVWRAYSAGPDSAVKVDPATYRPFYAADRGPDQSLRSWPADAWKIGGAAVWGWISYDPELDLIYYGTSNPGPWNAAQRPGDNKWATSTLARDPDDGSLRWAYQQTPHDMWDYDGVNENILVELPIGGRARKVLVRFDRNGFAYVQDRATGEVLSAEPYVYVNWATKVELATGRPRVNAGKMPSPDRWTRDICPSLEGGKDQQPAAWSPRTRLFYVPTNNICMDWLATEVSYIAGTPYIGASAPYHPGPGGHRGAFIAWDPVAARKVWEIREPYPVWSGALVTAGDVAFYGTLDGYLKAVDARTGEVLWKLKLGSGIVGNPITYLGPDGKQYIAVYSGVGGDIGALIAGDVRADAPYDTRAPNDFIPDLARHTSWGGMVWVLGL
ncbi:MAG TPA: PQQ-dependent dehydrogenase, methanol/ethanol family [Gemmatimonadaceae bacterium]|nr:PQQ-dependent dehydrogenase, methanol/ethanol family [Gemmatimonadaceae bacterium]